MLTYWPQIIVASLMLFGLWINLANHGKSTNQTYDFWVKLIAVIIEFVILYYGGFWK